jgi:hypothetical protein
MLVSNESRVIFLAQLAIFQGLDEAELQTLASQFAEYPVRSEDLLYKEGDRADNFYLLFSGELSQTTHDSTLPPKNLESGDHFGSPALLDGSLRTQTIHAIQDSILIYLPKRSFFDLISRYPAVADALLARVSAQELEAEIDFEWLQEGEKVHHLMRKHKAYLWQRFARPMILMIGALLAVNVSISDNNSGELPWLLIGGIGLFFAILWALWEFFDWRNDFYVLTNRRVVWLEHMLLRSSSRKEAPLSAIQQVNVHTSQIARLLGYGDIIVRTYTGTVPMPAVPAPHQVKEMIEEYVDREGTQSREKRHETIRQVVRQSLGVDDQEEQDDIEESQISESYMIDPGEPFQLFKTRHVDGDVITYHRHWFVLFSRLIFPSVFFVALIFGARTFFNGWPSDSQSLLITLAFLSMPIFVMIYRIFDWQNDIYQVTSENIIDSEKKPLGSEVTKSASLANILSLENHRIGLLGLLLNYGEVRINVGDSTLSFTDVHNPALVQQDIYVRMQVVQTGQNFARDDEERARMAEWLKVYEEERRPQLDPDEQLE